MSVLIKIKKIWHCSSAVQRSS